MSPETALRFDAPTPKKKYSVVLVGNPNCGKTSVFNGLTGLRYKVANYPGVTVEKKEGRLESELGAVTVSDLPGIYSLSATSLDERIATEALLGTLDDKPDGVIAVVDAANLERNLYLLTQVLDLNIPVVVALNMTDIAERRGISVKKEVLSRLLDVPVVGMVASSQGGTAQLRQELDSLLASGRQSTKSFAWLPDDSPLRIAAEELGKVAPIKGEGCLLSGFLMLSDVATLSSSAVKTEVDRVKSELSAKNIDVANIETALRYSFVREVCRRSCAITQSQYKSAADLIDYILTHRVWGMATFLIIMGFIFQSVFVWAQAPMDLIDSLIAYLNHFVSNALPPGIFRSLIADGIIAGVGSVLLFIPQIAILFLFIGLLEDSGYLSRAAFLMDRVLRPFGLQGRSFIPLLSSFACAIPGILSARTIPSRADRMTTILVAPLMSCSARLPVYTLLIAAFVPSVTYWGVFSMQGLVLLSMYLLGIVGALVVAFVLRFSVFHGEPALFVMEMPAFRWPSFKMVLREVLDRVVVFIKNAGTIILACSIVLWFLASHPRGELKDSYAGQLGHAIEPVIEPLGFNWEMGVGIIASFAAREVFVSSLATMYNLEDSSDTSSSLITLLKNKQATAELTLATALSLMVFYVFACQCMSTLAVCRRETGSWGWTAFMFFYMTGLAYAAAFVTYRGMQWAQ